MVNEKGQPSSHHDQTAATKPPWHGNWSREWRVGRFAFEIEWVPRARYYVFSFTIYTPEKDLERMEREAGYGR